MSYDISFETPRFGAALPEAWWDDCERNYTSNVRPMWVLALGNDTGIRALDGAPAVEAAGLLSAACERMEADPATYEALNPDNGWGDYTGALHLLRWMRDMASAHPDAVIRVTA